MRASLRCSGMLLALVFAGSVPAAPIVPMHDGEVIERLPAASLRGRAAADPSQALQEAQALLDAARHAGDPRLAGRALARLARWRNDPQAPAELHLALAGAEQYLHQFEPAIARLQALVQRDPRQAQAWLMLATLHRVQGRYAESDAGCRALQKLQSQPYAQACSAENLALRGDHASARRQLQALISAQADDGTRAWLLTTLAELEQRAGRAAASDQAWRQSLALAADAYTAVAYADFLLEQQRPADAWRVLQGQQRSDAVLLRQAVAARRAGRPEAAALQAELKDRFALADQRRQSTGHERERALMALEIEHDPVLAVQAARRNIALQREPLDIVLLARCAVAAQDADALALARRVATEMGLQDARLATL